jgi:hypothetical protein
MGTVWTPCLLSVVQVQSFLSMGICPGIMSPVNGNLSTVSRYHVSCPWEPVQCPGITFPVNVQVPSFLSTGTFHGNIQALVPMITCPSPVHGSWSVHTVYIKSPVQWDLRITLPVHVTPPVTTHLAHVNVSRYCDPFSCHPFQGRRILSMSSLVYLPVTQFPSKDFTATFPGTLLSVPVYCVPCIQGCE